MKVVFPWISRDTDSPGRLHACSLGSELLFWAVYASRTESRREISRGRALDVRVPPLKKRIGGCQFSGRDTALNLVCKVRELMVDNTSQTPRHTIRHTSAIPPLLVALGPGSQMLSLLVMSEGASACVSVAQARASPTGTARECSPVSYCCFGFTVRLATALRFTEGWAQKIVIAVSIEIALYKGLHLVLYTGMLFCWRACTNSTCKMTTA